MEELGLATRLIAIDSSDAAGVTDAMTLVADALEARGIPVERREVIGRPCLLARVGSGPTRLMLHGHIDVVPGFAAQFEPRLDGSRLVGRGAYDMKAALAAMVVAMGELSGIEGCTVELVVVPDEERADPAANATEELVKEGLRADLVVCGEPTNLMVGVQAKGVLMLRAQVAGRAAHGSTPWLGDNAILAGTRAFHRLAELPFAQATSAHFERASINLGRILGGDAINKVADRCVLDIDVRFLPGQDADDVLAQVASVADWELEVLLRRPPVDVDPDDPFVRLLLDAASAHAQSVAAVGRDGASDAVAFQEVGVPAVEFGPVGGGHHGPDEWVDVTSLEPYRRTLVALAERLGAGTSNRIEATA